MKKCFKEVYGTTINAYLQAYRMHTAAGLLRETNLDVTEIAGRVGYQMPASFPRCSGSIQDTLPNSEIARFVL